MRWGNLFALLAALTICLTACEQMAAPNVTRTSQTLDQTTPITSASASGTQNSDDIAASQADGSVRRVLIQIGSKQFRIVLEENPTAQALLEVLPQTLEMEDLNGNEKYYYFDEPLPSASAPVEKISAGDLMLYGSDCLVLFYEDFATTYRYTRIGKIEDAADLAGSLGNGKVSIVFTVED